MVCLCQLFVREQESPGKLTGSRDSELASKEGGSRHCWLTTKMRRQEIHEESPGLLRGDCSQQVTQETAVAACLLVWLGIGQDVCWSSIAKQVKGTEPTVQQANKCADKSQLQPQCQVQMSIHECFCAFQTGCHTATGEHEKATKTRVPVATTLRSMKHCCSSNRHREKSACYLLGVVHLLSFACALSGALDVSCGHAHSDQTMLHLVALIVTLSLSQPCHSLATALPQEPKQHNHCHSLDGKLF